MRQKLTFREYEQRRLGKSSGQLSGMITIFQYSFSSSTFAEFWRYWNPLFHYNLCYYCYKPLAKYLPRSVAVLLTFAASGAIHDFFASVILLDIYILFLPVFAFWGLLVVAEEGLALSFSSAPVWGRFAINTLIIVGTVLIGLKIRSMIT